MKYRIEYKDQSKDFRATSLHEFHNELFYCNGDGYKFFVDGKEVTHKEAFNAVYDAIDAKREKKLKTHKRVFISRGASCLPNTYQAVWIKK